MATHRDPDGSVPSVVCLGEHWPQHQALLGLGLALPGPQESFSPSWPPSFLIHEIG